MGNETVVRDAYGFASFVQESYGIIVPAWSLLASPLSVLTQVLPGKAEINRGQ
ncbi:hypothetical protein K449DRAFT_382107 [Hypoxylon sp. EC38]|nr:hypothetical protein K449DRAFT_382107 [Hypoxylon sp. EC38]